MESLEEEPGAVIHEVGQVAGLGGGEAGARNCISGFVLTDKLERGRGDALDGSAHPVPHPDTVGFDLAPGPDHDRRVSTCQTREEAPDQVRTPGSRDLSLGPRRK